MRYQILFFDFLFFVLVLTVASGAVGILLFLHLICIVPVQKKKELLFLGLYF